MQRFITGSVVLAGLAVMPAAGFAAETYAIDPQHVWVPSPSSMAHGPRCSGASTKPAVKSSSIATT